MEKTEKQQARELLLQTRFYKAMAAIFVAVGLIIFVMLYIKNVEGDLLAALKHPSVVLMLLLPFLPAIVLSWKAQKTEKKLFAILKIPDEQTDKK